VETTTAPEPRHLNQAKKLVLFTGYEKFVIGLLAFLQFTIILDFMVLSPLGAVLMPALHITPQQFGLVVSVYAFSAGTSGFLAAGFADRFDRKRLLLFFYTGFIIGTFLCAAAPSYPFLLGARVVTGLFGGVIGSIVFAIITDLFPYEKRGRVMGFIQTAFAASQILGIPLGLYFSNLWGWHAPFLMIVLIGLVAGVFILIYLRPINTHIQLQKGRNATRHLISTISDRRHLQAFATTALLTTGGFMLMPFSSAFTVHNLGISLEKLPFVYMVTGVCAIFAGPLIGRAADMYGKYIMFIFGTALTILMVSIYTRLGVTSLPLVMLINAVLFVGISARMIPAQALTSAVPDPSNRGSFMSVSASIQQISGGLASALAGAIVVEGANGTLEKFEVLGNVVVASTIGSVILMYFVNRAIQRSHSSPS
jgi:predicted MFS family arabinose efflux permease